MTTFAWFASFLACVFVNGFAQGRYKAAQKYEFENRTDGGSVEFASFEDAERHRKMKRRASMLGVFAQLGAVGSLIAALVSCNAA